jgi:hypothetical protein
MFFFKRFLSRNGIRFEWFAPADLRGIIDPCIAFYDFKDV